MEDAQGAIYSQSIWKTPGGGQENAAAIKFVGPTGFKRDSHRTYQRNIPLSWRAAQRRQQCLTEKNALALKAGSPEDMGVVTQGNEPLEGEEQAQRVPMFGPLRCQMQGIGVESRERDGRE